MMMIQGSEICSISGNLDGVAEKNRKGWVAEQKGERRWRMRINE